MDMIRLSLTPTGNALLATWFVNIEVGVTACTMNGCLPAGQNGQACTDNAGCISGNCVGGLCEQCSQVQTYCQVTGSCASTQTDPNNCGGCLVACSPVNDTPSCSGGLCNSACNAGFANCSGTLAVNGCNINLNTDPNHCGGCATVCNGTNDTPSCSGGLCNSTCNAGFANCSGTLTANGCNINLTNDPNNCGGCGVACGQGKTCTAGVCATGCGPGTTFCTSNNSCDNLSNDTSNCGTCGNACSFPNAASMCSGGTCAIGSCNAGFGNCDGSATNGCETNLNTSAANCGTCGNACSFANAAAMCSGGACAIGSCNAGFGNCDANATNGCETNLNTSAANCGACGNACATGQTCVAGACVTPPPLALACPASGATLGVPYLSAAVASGGGPPYSNYVVTLGALPAGLSMSSSTGAVTGTPSGPGGTFVGQVTDSRGTNATAGCFINVFCSSSLDTVCGSACVNLQTDPANCGSCGHACGPTQTCSAGACH